MDSNRSYFLYDSVTHLFYALSDGTSLGRGGADIAFPDDDDIDVIHLRFHLKDGAITVTDVSENADRARVNSFPIQKKAPRKLSPGELLGVGQRRFIITTQNQYRPMPMASAVDKTMVGPTDATTILPETLAEQKRDAAEAKRKSPSAATLARSAPAEKRGGKKIRQILPALIAAGVAYLILSDPDGAVRVQIRKVRAPRPSPTPDMSWANPTTPPVKPPSKPNRLVLPADAGAVTFTGGGTGETYWEAYQIENAPVGTLYIKNLGVLTKRAPFAAMKESDRVLREFLKLPVQGWHLPLGPQKEAEAAADAACQLAQTQLSKIPFVTLDQMTDDTVTGITDLKSETQDPRGGPLPDGLYTARFATIRFPLLDSKIELTSIPIRCEDPIGARIKFSQQRATLFHVIKTRAGFAGRLNKHEADRVKTIASPAAIESLKSTRLSSLIKGCRNLILQVNGFVASTTSSEWKEAGQQLAGYLSDDINELSKQYAVGENVHPAYFPPIKPNALLQEGDLLFLSAY